MPHFFAAIKCSGIVDSLEKYVAGLSNLSQVAAVHSILLEVALHNTDVNVLLVHF